MDLCFLLSLDLKILTNKVEHITMEYCEFMLMSEHGMTQIPVRRLIIKERMIVNNVPTPENHKKDNLYKMKTPSLKHAGKFVFNWCALQKVIQTERYKMYGIFS